MTDHHLHDSGGEPHSRYLTFAGVALSDSAITVDVIGDDRYSTDHWYVCRGCGIKEMGVFDWHYARKRAQEHAESCRGVPVVSS